MPDEAPDRVVLGTDTTGEVVSVEADEILSIRALCPRPGNTTPRAETSRTTGCPQWIACLDYLRDGDYLVIHAMKCRPQYYRLLERR